MAKKATDVMHVNLRLHPALWKQLESAAKERDTTLSGEIRQRLEQSFRTEMLRSLENVRRDFEGTLTDFEEASGALETLCQRLDDTNRNLEDTRRDINNSWGLYGTRVLQLNLERELVVALERADNLDQVKALAKVWLINRDENEPRYQHQIKKRGE